MADRVGQALGNYRLTRLLGRGGFAEVYLGEHRRLGTQAAIKVLYTHVATSEEETFLAEARTIAHLEHPHIVRILDFDVQEGTPFLVMSYALNGTLRQRHTRGARLPLPLVHDYLTQITAALQYAHEQKVIHRDIKPENMLLGRHEEVLLSDFGIALIAQSSRLQSTQDVVGTASYMAPEQLQGKPRLASDQYALAVVLYEWLTGERPFHGTFVELYSQHLSVPPPSLRDKVPTLSPELDQVILTALAKDPTQRFASVKAFATAFEQAMPSPSRPPRPVIGAPAPTSIISSSASVLSPAPLSYTSITPPHTPPVEMNPIPPTTSSPEPLSAALSSDQTSAPSGAIHPIMPSFQQDGLLSPPPPALAATRTTTPPRPQAAPSPRQGQRISRRTMVIGLATLTVVGGGTWLLLSQLPPGAGTTLYTYKGHSSAVAAVAWSPDGKRIASASSDNTVQVWNATDGSSPYIYKGHSGPVNAVAWSPDGQQIASGSSDGTVQVWNATDGSAAYTYKNHIREVNAVAWSPDGKRIASGSSDNTVRVWNAADGSASYTYMGHFTYLVTAVAWSPDGKRIASGSSDHTVQVWNAADGGSRYTYTGHSSTVNAVAWSPDGKWIASGSSDNTVQIWNGAHGSSMGYSSAVNAVAWSPDSKRIASGSSDNTVQVRNAADGSYPYTYRGHSDIVNAVAWSPDGKRVASSSSDNTVQVWQGP